MGVDYGWSPDKDCDKCAYSQMWNHTDRCPVWQAEVVRLREEVKQRQEEYNKTKK